MSKRNRGLYDFPIYYDIAFSFRDIHHEAQVFDECFRRFSRIPVTRVLELGSGTAPHLEEWKHRGIEYLGIDTNNNMLNYARKKALRLRTAATFLEADMRRFSVGKSVDFVYAMLGSLYVETTSDIVSHLKSVAEALNPGGLYFLDWCVNFQWGDRARSSHWTIKRKRVKIKAGFRTDIVDRASQMVRNNLTVDVDDDGKLLHLESTDVLRTIFPQEFLMFVKESGRFDFVGWWNHWDLQEPIEKATRISRPIVLLRRNDHHAFALMTARRDMRIQS